MTDQATADVTAPESAPAAAPTAAEVWEKVNAEQMADSENQEPITKEAVKGEKPDEPKERTLVAPQIKKMLEARKAPTVNPLEERLARIEAALTAPKEEPKAPGLEEKVDALTQIIQEKETAAAKAAAEAAEEEQWGLLREGVISNLREAADKFPLLVGLGQEDNVYKTLRAELEAGKEVSEDDIASKAEAKLQAAYDKMHGLKSGGNQNATSEDPDKSETKTTPNTTLTPGLTASDAPTDVESILQTKGGDRKAAAEELWNNLLTD